MVSEYRPATLKSFFFSLSKQLGFFLSIVFPPFEEERKGEMASRELAVALQPPYSFSFPLSSPCLIRCGGGGGGYVGGKVGMQYVWPKNGQAMVLRLPISPFDQMQTWRQRKKINVLE
ncbi:hypothetical protein TWF751_006396 [Orbilia oligospora]|nr:hypothetical protein TWF751_006396 [Orbilia oligospora]